MMEGKKMASQTMVWKGGLVNFDNEFDTGHKLLNSSLENWLISFVFGGMPI